MRRTSLTCAVAVSGVVLLSGCTVPGATVINLDAPPSTPSTSPSASPSSLAAPPSAPSDQCLTVSKAAIAAVDSVVRAKGEGNSLPHAVALRDAASGLWLITGGFEGPAGEGDGALGIWATAQDPSAKDFASPILAVDDAASAWSTAEPALDVAYDPTDVPVLGCLDQTKN